MSALNPQGPLPTPDLAALLQLHAQDVFSSLRCHAVGVIVSFDAAAQTASVRIAAQAVVYNRPQGLNAPLQSTPAVVEYPLLTDVPVFVPSGGGGRLTLPVAPGDTCLLLFNDRDMDAWFQSGASVPPNSGRMHSISDALAIVGFRSRANPVQDYSADDVELILAGGKVAIRADGSVLLTSVGGAAATLAADGTLLAESADGTTVALDDKVLIANASGSLRAAMDLVITALTALNAKTGPSAAAQITAAQTALEDLLKP